ncbi:MAG: hypothetical protein P0Y65_17190 [Candidatus Devosia phytovorans]|uniref:Uncharacterized protein n=1 Tax=Candidatus Devosia phytovorans TaxID=3121372 RepID=A0AAJ6AZK3_9HYPH|nr:hypothetical protein [Devosia sp.]WEK03906.1 MAG: hypothetical protein P0Y65_17190 [Devosia sp.]
MTTDTRRPDLRLVLAVFAIAVVILMVRATFGRAGEPFFADTDDAMRMVMVRDFIHGQNWYDLTAHRLNTPWGAELHWSRLVDLPIGLLVMLFTPVLGADTAMVAAGAIWPMALLGLLLWLSALLANRLVGPEGVLPALILPVLSPAVTAEFTPGRVDHHNVIILLTVAMVWAAVEAMRRPRFAMFCGLFAATALAIATESLPPIGAAIAVMGLVWVFDPARARTMRLFGLSFAAASLIHLAIFRPPSRWLEAACDVISPFYVGIALVVGLVFTLASFLPLRAAWQRFAALAVLGLAGVAAIVLIYPQCLGGPYAALDPWLQQNWIAGIIEARPLFVTIHDLPAYTVAVALPALLAVVVILVRLWRVPQQRDEWAVLLVFLLATALIMLIQIRGARLAIMPAMPAAAWLIVAARQRYLAKQRLPQIFGLLGSWLVFSGVVLSLIVTLVVNTWPGRAQEVAEVRASKEACLLPSAFADLAALPPERVMTPIDLGAHMLLYTPHEVVSAPYHRNQRGVRDTFRFFNDPIATAREILDERGIGLVVLCPGMPEVAGLEDRAPDSFANLYAAGNLPAWLDDVSLPDSPLVVLAVLPD